MLTVGTSTEYDLEAYGYFVNAVKDDITECTKLLAVKKFDSLEKEIELFDRIMSVTHKVIALPDTEASTKIQTLWGNTLQQYHQKKIQRIAAPPIILDCSIAMEMVKTKSLPVITYEKIDRQSYEAVENAIQIAYEIDYEFFKESNVCPKIYWKHLLFTAKAECFVAKVNEKCVGIFAGFYYTTGDSTQFYVTIVGRKGCVAQLGVGEGVMKKAFDALTKNQKIDHINLHVDSDNEKAISLYDALGFSPSAEPNAHTQQTPLTKQVNPQAKPLVVSSDDSYDPIVSLRQNFPKIDSYYIYYCTKFFSFIYKYMYR